MIRVFPAGIRRRNDLVTKLFRRHVHWISTRLFIRIAVFFISYPALLSISPTVKKCWDSCKGGFPLDEFVRAKAKVTQWLHLAFARTNSSNGNPPLRSTVNFRKLTHPNISPHVFYHHTGCIFLSPKQWQIQSLVKHHI